MIRRLAWFLSGAIAGVTGLSWARRKMVLIADQITPSNVGHLVVVAVRRTARQVRRSVRAAVIAYRGAGESTLVPFEARTSARDASHRHNSPRRRSTHR